MAEITSENKQDFYNRSKQIELKDSKNSVKLTDTDNDIIRVRDRYSSSSINMGEGNDTLYSAGQTNITLNNDGGNDVIYLPSNRRINFSYNVKFADDDTSSIFVTRKGNDLVLNYGDENVNNCNNSLTFKNYFRYYKSLNDSNGNINIIDKNSDFLILNNNKDIFINGKDGSRNSLTNISNAHSIILGGDNYDRISINNIKSNNNEISQPIEIRPGEGNDYTSIKNTISENNYYFNPNDGSDTVNLINGDLTIHLETFKGRDFDFQQKGNNAIIIFKNPDGSNSNDKLTIQNYFSPYKNAGKVYLQTSKDQVFELVDKYLAEFATKSFDEKKGRTIISGSKGTDNITIDCQGNFDKAERDYDLRANNGDDKINVDYAWNANIRGDRGNDTINIAEIYDSGQSTIDGGYGNDIINITRSNGDAIVNGGNGNDTIVVESASYNSENGYNIKINGGSGADNITVKKGSAYIDLGTAQKGRESVTTSSGNDYVQASKDTNYNTSIDTGDGNDIVRAGRMRDSSINLGKGKDVVYMQNAINTSVDARNGNNTYNLDYSRNTLIILQENLNTINAYKSREANITVSGLEDQINGGYSNKLNVKLQGSDSIVNVERARYSNFEVGTNDADELATATINTGRYGASIKLNKNSDIVVNLENNNDSFYVSDLDNLVFSKENEDLILKDDMNNTVHISNFYDKRVDRLKTKIYYEHNETHDETYAYLNEILAADPNYNPQIRENYYSGSIYADTIDDLSSSNVTIKGGNGFDTITAGDGNNLIYGDRGSDNITVGNGNNKIYAGYGYDTINVGSGDNTIYGDRGFAHIETGNGANTIYTASDKSNIETGTGNDTIYGKSRYEVNITDQGGNNYIKLGNSVNEVETGAGNDTIYTGYKDDTINSGAGNDYINAGRGNNKIELSLLNGNDTIVVNSNYKTNDTITFNDIDNIDDLTFHKDGNNLKISAGNSDGTTLQNFFKYREDRHSIDKIQNGNGDEIDLNDITVNIDVNQADAKGNLKGTYLNDVFTVNAENMDGKIINLSGGNDTIRLEGIKYENITKIGPAENPRDLILETANGQLTIKNYYSKLTGASPSVNYFEFDDTIIVGDDINKDKPIIMDGITKTYKGDFTSETIVGSSENDIIYGYSGSDSIEGGLGNDKIYAGDNFAVEQGDGDTITGGIGNDTIYTSNETTNIVFNTGDDTDSVYRNSKGGTTYYDMKDLGSFDTDLGLKKEGNDLAIFNKNGSNSEDKVLIKNYFSKTRAEYEDIIKNAKGDEFNIFEDGILNTTYDPELNNKIEGTKLVDIINCENATKGFSVRLGDSNDTITTGAGNDVIYGDDGDDLIITNSGNDKIYGGNGNDIIKAGNGHDYINAGTGNNEIHFEGDFGRDTVVSGKGSDSLILDVEQKQLSHSRYRNDLRIYVDENKENYITIRDYFRGNHSAKYIVDSNKDTISLNDFVTGKQINGTDGNDYLSGGAGNNTIITGAGNDTIVGGFSNEITAVSGDNLIFGGIGNDIITTGNGNDTIYSSQIQTKQDFNDIIKAGSGNDIIYSYSSNNEIDLGLGDDTIYSSSNENTNLTKITDGGGNDTYYIANGNRAIINDTDGDFDVIKLETKKGSLIFDVTTSEFKIYEFNSTKDIVRFGSPDNGNTIEEVHSLDNFKITTSKLNELKSNVEGWLSQNDFTSFEDAIQNAETKQMQDLLTIYNNAWEQIPTV